MMGARLIAVCIVLGTAGTLYAGMSALPGDLSGDIILPNGQIHWGTYDYGLHMTPWIAFSTAWRPENAVWSFDISDTNPRLWTAECIITGIGEIGQIVRSSEETIAGPNWSAKTATQIYPYQHWPNDDWNMIYGTVDIHPTIVTSASFSLKDYPDGQNAQATRFYGDYVVKGEFAQVPEPSSWLVLAGLMAIGAIIISRRRAPQL